MKEISLNILDIAENSVRANATLTKIELNETDSELLLKISDDGSGMEREVLEGVINPFYTTRTTRKVGLGIPLIKLAAEQTGGSFEIRSKHINEHPENHGTVVEVKFIKNHIDYTPLGDTVSTVTTLIQGHPETDFVFCHEFFDKSVLLDTRELRRELGDIPLNTYEVIKWVEEYLVEQYSTLYS